MARSRLNGLLRPWLVSLAWAAAGGEAAWALVGVPLVDVRRPAVELSIRAGSGEAAFPQDPSSLPVPSGSKGSASAPFSCPWQFLQGTLCPLEEALFADAADGRWDEHSLLRAALVASGTLDDEALGRYETQVDRLAAELEQSGRMTGPPRSKAQALLEFMHASVLAAGYQLDSTDLRLALDEGRFNCVSASVLFNCLAGRFGLCARGLEIPGHAMSRLILPDGTLDVETTCPGWFRLMDDPEKQAELVATTIGLRPAEGGSPVERREVSDVELVGTIYYNRGVDLLAQKQFAEAVASNAKALRLDPLSTTARGNLLATINNWAIDLDSQGRHAEAVDLLRQGLALDPHYETFKVNYVHVHSQWVEELCSWRHYREALDLIGRAAEDHVEEAYFVEVRRDVYRRWARAHLEAGETDRAFAAFDEAKRLDGRVANVLEAEAAEVSRRATSLLEQGRFAEAVALLDKALARQPDSPVLGDVRRTAVTRWALPAFQNGDYAEAIRRTTHGATPGRLHQTLVDNVRYGYYQWISGLLAHGRHLEARRIARQAMADPFLAGQVGGAIPQLLAN